MRGALLNGRINAAGLEDAAAAQEFLGRGGELGDQARAHEAEILAVVEGRIA